MIRDELVIVYSTLSRLLVSYPELTNTPPIVYDQTSEAILASTFPCIGIRRIASTTDKKIDKNEEYKRSEDAGRVFAWYETGRFSYSCSVGLYMAATDQIPNPIPLLRSWSLWVEKRISRQVRFPCENDPSGPGETIKFRSVATPFERSGKLLHSIKLTIDADGKFLEADELSAITSGIKGKWIVHSNPAILK